ncbi:MAG: DivIVA domain-containing protein [Bacilli bacterium]|nr:DivIVA domain-containing protein [Bacilli bacterium]
MERFNRILRGYDPEEVNAFLDQVIARVELMVSDIEKKDKEIKELKVKLAGIDEMQEKLGQYERMEDTLNRAILMAQKSSDQMKLSAHRESELLLEDAKSNASRIVNEALMRAEKIENESITLKRNVNIFKRRLKDIIESQLDVIEEIDKVEL